MMDDVMNMFFIERVCLFSCLLEQICLFSFTINDHVVIMHDRNCSFSFVDGSDVSIASLLQIDCFDVSPFYSFLFCFLFAVFPSVFCAQSTVWSDRKQGRRGRRHSKKGAL